MNPDEAVHPPEPLQENPWDHIAPKFTVAPRFFDQVVDDILKPHGGSMKTFLQALDDAKVDPEDMVTLTDALEGIDAFLKSPPKDPDFEHLTVMREIDLDEIGIQETIYKIFGTNNGDIVITTDQRIVRFDNNGNLLWKTEVPMGVDPIYQPTHDRVFFVQDSLDAKTFSLHELDRNGVVLEPLYTSAHHLEVLVDPDGDLVLVEGRYIEDAKISRFNLIDMKITDTQHNPFDDQHFYLCVLRGGVLVVDQYDSGIHDLTLFDTKTGKVTGKGHTDDRIVSIFDLQDGTIACNGVFRDEQGVKKISIDIIDPHTAQGVRSIHTNMRENIMAMMPVGPKQFDILPSGKLVKIAYDVTEGRGHYFLQTLDTRTEIMSDIYTLSQPPQNFCTAPDGKIIIQYWREGNSREGNKILVLG